jgi:hypothetical protein
LTFKSAKEAAAQNTHTLEKTRAKEIHMTKLLSLSVASLIVLTAGIAFADPFSSTITSGSTITALRGAACGGTADNYDVTLPAGCTGTIDPVSGDIVVSSCTFAPSTQVPGFIITLSASSGSGNYDGTTLALTPDINVNVTDNPPSAVNCDSASPISPPLSGTVTGGSGSISFSGSVSGPSFPTSATCPPVIAGTLNCLLDTVTGATLNLTIP